MKQKQLITVSIREAHRDTLLRLSKWLHGGDLGRTLEAAIEQYDDKIRGAWDHGTVNATFDQYKTTPGNPAERQDTKQ